MKVLVLLALVGVALSAVDMTGIPSMDDFELFMDKFEKKYETTEEKLQRFVHYMTNMLVAKRLNENELGTATYGETPFSDMSAEEFRRLYRTKGFQVPEEFHKLPLLEGKGKAIPKNWDWRQHGAVTKVKDQGQCGSCWAFSVTGNIEGQWAINKKALLSLSEQELVDCDKVDQGCNGGLPLDAYKEIIRIGGLELEKDYPYTAEDGQCHFDKNKVAVKINGSMQVPANEKKMANVLYHHGPLSIGINADVMQYYTGGISHPSKYDCDPEYLDHGVLIVGYGVQNGVPYWTIKNSWADSWGEKGYYRAYRGANVCGLDQMVTSATL